MNHGEPDLSGAVALFRSLADPTRLAIVHELARGERRVVDLTRALGLAQSTTSGHLACLADCGLVTSRPAGRQSFCARGPQRPAGGSVLRSGTVVTAKSDRQLIVSGVGGWWAGLASDRGCGPG